MGSQGVGHDRVAEHARTLLSEQGQSSAGEPQAGTQEEACTGFLQRPSFAKTGPGLALKLKTSQKMNK